MMRICSLVLLGLVCLLPAWIDAAEAGRRLVVPADLTLTNLVASGWGKALLNRAIGGAPMRINERTFETGISAPANKPLYLELDGGEAELHTWVGVDDATLPDAGSIEFFVFGDERELWRSGVMRRGDAARELRLPLRGVRVLILWAAGVGDGHCRDLDWAGTGLYAGRPDWAGWELRVSGSVPKAHSLPPEPAILLTPPPPPAPRINGPLVYGARPGRPFLYRIPCTGERPIKFNAQNLPAGLTLDATSGIITGSTPARGDYQITLAAENSRGKSERAFKLVAGETLALTPPMGWNDWYAHYARITDPMMRRAADIMISSGMADAGYQYVNIDDCWMNSAVVDKHQPDPERVGKPYDALGNILPNRFFPDMKAMTDYIHGQGLKAGIYISPGPRTCAGFTGAYGHEPQAARQFANWGFDFLKYDWCTYHYIAKGGDPNCTNCPDIEPFISHEAPNLAAHQRPYRLMGGLLQQQNRDIVFNLDHSGYGEIYKWGQSVGGHSWRTGNDLGLFLDKVFEVALKNAELREFSKPGGWNDPDYIQIGFIGDAHTTGQPRPCGMSLNEQYAFMSLWCMMAAPLFYSGDLERLEASTINVLCNPEMIEIDQDELGQCARVIPVDRRTFIMVKDLADGSQAVGLFNRGPVATRMRVAWADLGLSGPQRVRDVWRQRDLGVLGTVFESAVPRRGGVVIRVKPAPVAEKPAAMSTNQVVSNSWTALKREVLHLGKPQWRPLLAYVASLHEKSTHPAIYPFAYDWEEIGPGYMAGPAFGHWDVVHQILDVLPANSIHAYQQLLNNIQNQERDGLIPGSIWMKGGPSQREIVSWNKDHGHPPVWVVAVDDYVNQTGDTNALKTFYAALVRQIDWFERDRKADTEGYFYTDILNHKWESGVDEGVRFDDAGLGRWACIDATSHVYLMYVHAAKWSKALGLDGSAFLKRQEALRAFIQNDLYAAEDGSFYDIWAKQDPQKRHVVFENMWPIVVGAATPEQANRYIDHFLLNPNALFSPHPISTVGVNDKKFQLRMWRGTSWNSMNYWAVRGCLNYGRKDAALLILERALDQTAKQFDQTGTIWEFYHPLGGSPRDLKRKPNHDQPCTDYLGHNPVIAMARYYDQLKGESNGVGTVTMPPRAEARK